MKFNLKTRLSLGAFALAAVSGAQSLPPIVSLQTNPSNEANVFIPESSRESVLQIGRFAHTNFRIWLGADDLTREASAFDFDNLSGPALRPAVNPKGFHPNQLISAYGAGSNSGGVIAIVDAFHYPTALADFNTFATQFNLPTESSTNATAAGNKVFQVVYATGKQPATNAGWGQEMALDIEWAHAMAPKAKIVLVEAASSGFTDLFNAVTAASKIAGVTQISMSWGGSEFSGETSADATLAAVKSATLFASSGDTGGSKNYPALSPSVVCVGGTSLVLDSNNNWSNETVWTGSGGGASAFFSIPSFQSSVSSVVGKKRGGPDIAAVANPSTGVAVYDSTPSGGFSGWFVVGGTSLSSPLCAGLANSAGGNRGNGELAWIYGHSSGFHDIISGKAGSNSAAKGWDFTTGWGSPKAAGSL